MRYWGLAKSAIEWIEAPSLEKALQISRWDKKPSAVMITPDDVLFNESGQPTNPIYVNSNYGYKYNSDLIFYIDVLKLSLTDNRG